MSVFNEAMQQKGQAEEDLFFAKLDLELIAALHKKIAKEHKASEDMLIEADLDH